MIQRLFGAGVLVIVTLVGAACEDTRAILGQGKRSPDEFAVYSRVPLSVPPGYGLRPPGPTGGDVIGSGSPQADARRALLSTPSATKPGGDTKGDVEPLSPGTYALLQRTGGLTADPAIRSIVNRETTILADADQSFTERLMFWQTRTVYGTVVDADEEAKRIRENLALGKPVTEGPTPTIERRKRALLEGIFN